MVDYKEFSFKCRDMINELYSVKSLTDKAILLQNETFKPSENLEEINLSRLDLFKVSPSFLTFSVVIQKIRFEPEWFP